MSYARVALGNGQAYTLRLDIYWSPEQNAPGPCIIYIFSGGFLWGEHKQVTQKAIYCRDLVYSTKEGYTVVCPDYRLVSQSIFPACAHNVKGVARFLKVNGERHSIDPDRTDALGNSAGGYLASILALSANCRELEEEVSDNLECDSSIKVATIFYTPADLYQSIRTSAITLSGPPRDSTGTEIENVGNDSAGIVPALIMGYTGPGRSLLILDQVPKCNDPGDPDWHSTEPTKKHNPVIYTGAGCPPVTVFQGGRDTIVDPGQSETLYRALVEVGAGAAFVACSGGGHGPSLGEEVDQLAYNFLKGRL